MKPIATFLALAIIVLLGFGCTRTYISTGAPGVPSPDGSTRLCLTSHGAYGRAYTDKTKKQLDVWIGRGSSPNETTLFSRTYKFVGSDLWAHAEWISADQVALHVYDYGDGVSRYDARTTSAPSNHIAQLTFQLDKKTGKFTEKK